MPFSGIGLTPEQEERAKERLKTMLGSTPNRTEDLREPMIPINHTGWGIKLKDIVTILSLVFVGGGAYVAVTSQLDGLQQRLTVLPSDVQKSVAELRQTVVGELQDIKRTQESNRQERMTDIKELAARVANGEAERARIGQKVDNLQDLMQDIRDLMREQRNGVPVPGKMGRLNEDHDILGGESP